MVHTGISLNERFTQMQTQKPQPQGRGRSRSRSRSRRIVDSNAGSPGVSAANSRLLQEFKRRHTVQTALKLKRRSLRNTAVIGRGVRVGGVKSMRLAPNGKPIRSNNVTRVATMRADLVANGNIGRNRRSGSANRRLPASGGGGGGGLRQRLGQRRPSVGGAAERVERRQRQQQQQQQQQTLRGRSRSRSRSRLPQAPRVERGRSQSRGRSSAGRSQSRNRGNNRDRSAQGRVPVKQRLSVKYRLGVRPGQSNQTKNPRQQRASSQLRGVAGGRVEKRRNGQNTQKKGISASLAGRRGPQRGRSATRNSAAAAKGGGAGAGSAPASARRSRSRNRAAAVTAAAVAAVATTSGRRAKPRQRRGRSAAAAKGNNNNSNNNKNSNRNGNTNKNGKGKAANKGKQGPGPQQQARRGRSRSRKPSTGKAQRPEVKREDLDKELDVYMSTTKSEMDYLLK
ncbi:micronuclear linker histone polyprotein [Drosophila kikkawai]|uniref:Micronuclear linker histone polyprotein n=1 Tax=Drosophila kikkawai TaxID=30033 RepID=A0A6P4IRI9_DROKI|nr:serine/arginine repetitive matrix protein 2 [Drosophila kikkawai]